MTAERVSTGAVPARSATMGASRFSANAEPGYDRTTEAPGCRPSDTRWSFSNVPLAEPIVRRAGTRDARQARDDGRRLPMGAMATSPAGRHQIADPCWPPPDGSVTAGTAWQPSRAVQPPATAMMTNPGFDWMVAVAGVDKR